MKGYAVNIVVVLLLAICDTRIAVPVEPPSASHPNLDSALAEKIRHFSINLLYQASQNSQTNFIICPVTVWTALAVTAEGAGGNTMLQIQNALQLNIGAKQTRAEYSEIAKWLKANTSNVELVKMNAMFFDSNHHPLPAFTDNAKKFYDVDSFSLDFDKREETTLSVNRKISDATYGMIPKLIDSDSLIDSKLILTSAVYFKGMWAVPFSNFTFKQPFFNSEGKKIGDVTMMTNTHKYRSSYSDQINARIIELPYGTENRLSMIIMLPYHSISLESMLLSLKNTTLQAIFEELTASEMIVYLPRFKVEEDMDMTPVLKDAFGIVDLFDPVNADLHNMSTEQEKLYVKKIVHKAYIEVTEEGTAAAGVTAVQFENRFGPDMFEVNSPFAYIIVEKVTSTIVFCGVYREPSL